jgi:hypothetical protein
MVPRSAIASYGLDSDTLTNTTRTSMLGNFLLILRYSTD